MAASDHLSPGQFQYPPGMEITYRPPGEGKYPDMHELYAHVPDDGGYTRSGEGGLYAPGQRNVISLLRLAKRDGEIKHVGTSGEWQRHGLASHLMRTAQSMGLRPRWSDLHTDDGAAFMAAHGMSPKKPLAGKPRKRTKKPEQLPLF